MSLPSLFEQNYRALVIGASGAIGTAFAEALQKDPRCTYTGRVSRTQPPGFDLQSADSIRAAAIGCAGSGPYHLIIDATGVLVVDGVGPEKSLAAIRDDVIAKAFQINAIGPLMVLRNFAPLLASGPSIYAKLSARVGSITDNRKGGWYSYRASKAALNMLLQTAAFELQRKNAELRVVALQPGTVRSELSRPFTADVANLLEPAASVAGMLATLRELKSRPGAHFVDYRGNEVPW
jgi:NAD(P)-dependent dehydrogenase (short-subunit alcohol dehydrogenase family)